MQRRDFLATSLAGAALMGNGTSAQGATRFIVPPEEDHHEATILMWPVSRKVYSDRYFLEIVQETIATIANTIVEFEPVILLAAAEDHAQAKHLLSDKVTLWDVPTEDLWTRDAGPIIARAPSGKRVVSHIKFNGWGRKQVHARDGLVAERMATALGFDLIDSGLSGEGGGVEQDGHGSLLAHESSWVINNRNPGLSRAEVEARLLAAYGAERMIWAPGLKGHDITDYHIDALARFTGPGRVLMNLPDAPDMSEPFTRTAYETHDILKDKGLNLTVIPEPILRRVNADDFVASYVNYYVCNGAVIAAQFGDPETDAIAADTLAKAFPGHEIVTLDTDVLGEIGGGIHCATQQIPA